MCRNEFADAIVKRIRKKTGFKKNHFKMFCCSITTKLNSTKLNYFVNCLEWNINK